MRYSPLFLLITSVGTTIQLEGAVVVVASLRAPRQHMLLRIAKLALLMAAALSQLAAEVPPSDRTDVLRLTDHDYAATLADSPLLAVKFCARWSRPCKLLATEYRAAAQLLARNGHTGILAELDASEEMRSAQHARIVSYPTIKLFRRGQVVDTFAGQFTADAMAAYVQQ